MKAQDLIDLIEGMEGVAVVNGSTGDLGTIPMNPLKVVSGRVEYNDEIKKKAKKAKYTADGRAILYDGDGVILGYVDQNDAQELNLPRSGGDTL